MHVVVDVFADQIFRSGFVHCDPHPGNIIIRDNPKTGAPQVKLSQPTTHLYPTGSCCSSKPRRKSFCAQPTDCNSARTPTEIKTF